MRDVESATGMSFSINDSILHFSPHDIIDKATSIRVTLGSTGREISKSINDLLDLEVDRALDLVRNLATVKPMQDSEVNDLGGLNSLCDSLAPTEDLEDGADEVLDGQGVGDQSPQAYPQISGYMD